MGDVPLLLAVAAGVLAAVNPCGFALLPAYLSLLVLDGGATRRAAVVALGRIGDARAVEPLIRLLGEEDRDLLVAVTAALVAVRTVSIWLPISAVALAVCAASAFTSPATTANPLPASPARAASIVAFSASRLVLAAISPIGLRVPSTFDMPVTATSFVRSVSTSSSAERSRRPSAVSGMKRNTAPRSCAICCQGTRLA